MKIETQEDVRVAKALGLKWLSLVGARERYLRWMSELTDPDSRYKAKEILARIDRADEKVMKDLLEFREMRDNANQRKS